MRGLIRTVCALSVLCGLAQSLCPEGSAKRAMSFACAVVMLSGLVRGLKGLDWEAYSLESAELRLRQEELQERGEELRRSLDRRVIEQEYAAYILDTARNEGLSLEEAKVSARWSMEGLWLPYGAELTGNLSASERRLLSDRIEADLGIPLERQEWRQGSG